MSLRTLPLLVSALTLALLVTSVTTSAYIMKMESPKEIYVGEVLKIVGETNLPTGVTASVVVYDPQNAGVVVFKKYVTIQQNIYNSNKFFSVSFDTLELSPGKYKVEIPEFGNYKYLGDSHYIDIVNILDPYKLVVITSPKVQTNNAYEFELFGSVSGYSNKNITIELYDYIGRSYIELSTIRVDSSCKFKYIVPLTRTGDFTVYIKNDDNLKLSRFNITLFRNEEPIKTPQVEKIGVVSGHISSSIVSIITPTLTQLPNPTVTQSSYVKSTLLTDNYIFVIYIIIIFGVVAILLLAFFIYRIVRPKKDELEDEWVGGQLYGDDFYEKK